MSFFKKPADTTITQEALLTPEQIKAMSSLMSYGETGRIGDFQAGEAYKGSLGEFQSTDIEKLAGNKLLGLMNSSMPAGLAQANDVYSKIAAQGFNPDDPQFKAYKTAALRQAGESADVLNRDASSMGSYFSSGLNKEKGLLAERTQQDLTGKLAGLFDTAQNRALQAAGGLANNAMTEEGINQGRVEQGFNLGGLERVLANAEAQAKYAEFQRARNERVGAIDGVNAVLNKNVNYGVKSMTLPGGNSPFQNLLNSALKAGGTALGTAVGGPIGASIGGGIGDSLGGLFSGGNQPGTGKSQSEILGMSTKKYI